MNIFRVAIQQKVYLKLNILVICLITKYVVLAYIKSA